MVYGFTLRQAVKHWRPVIIKQLDILKNAAAAAAAAAADNDDHGDDDNNNSLMNLHFIYIISIDLWVFHWCAILCFSLTMQPTLPRKVTWLVLVSRYRHADSCWPYSPACLAWCLYSAHESHVEMCPY